MSGQIQTMEKSHYLKKQFFCVFGFVLVFLPCSLQTALNTDGYFEHADTVLMCIHKIQPVM